MKTHTKATTEQVLSQRRLDLAPTPNGRAVPKFEKFNWDKLGSAGEFTYIAKTDLLIDPSYQRDKPTDEWALALARNWDWPSCGVLIVSERDNKWWVIDGQGRYTASLLRTDIKELPCLVFRNSSIDEEAATFLKVNAHRRSVASFAKYRASLTAKDQLATFIDSTLRAYGYSVGLTGGPKVVACIATVCALAKENRERFLKMWPLFTQVHQDCEIYGDVIKGLWEVEKAWAPDGKKSLTIEPYFSRLVRVGGPACLAEIRRLTVMRGKGGRAVYRDAVLAIIKKRI